MFYGKMIVVCICMREYMKKYPYPVYETNEDDVLNMLVLQDIFPILPDNQQIVVGLRLQGFTQGAISRLLNISRTSIGSLEKQAVSFLSLKITQEK